MFFKGLPVIEDILVVSSTELVKLRAEDFVDSLIEVSWAIGLAKLHKMSFKTVLSSAEGGYLFTSIRNANYIISIADVRSSKNLCFLQLHKGLLN